MNRFSWSFAIGLFAGVIASQAAVSLAAHIRSLAPANASSVTAHQTPENTPVARRNGNRSSYRGRQKKYTSYIRAAAEESRIDPDLLAAIIHVESSYNPEAENAGAVGLMQLTSATALRFGVSNRRNPEENIQGGARYLRHLLDHFDSDLRLALAAYNMGENALKRRKRIPRQVQHYISKVMTAYEARKSINSDNEQAA